MENNTESHGPVTYQRKCEKKSRLLYYKFCVTLLVIQVAVYIIGLKYAKWEN